MEGTMAEIRLFAGDFAPKTWSYCNGALLAISSNQALFSLLGVTYGGNGMQSFGLPDLRGRIPVGVGNGAASGLSNYALGELSGTESVTLMPPNLPEHTHSPIVSKGTGAPSATINLKGVNDAGGQTSPEFNLLGTDNQSGATTYASSGTLTPMNAASVVLADVTLARPTATANLAGGSQPHTNIMPSLVLNYIICMYGIFPSRN